MRKALFVVLWIACGVYNRGFVMGDFTMQFPAQHHEAIADMFAVMGPIGSIPATIGAINGAPFMWHGYTCQQRYNAFGRDLSKDYFVQWGDNMDCRVENLKD